MGLVSNPRAALYRLTLGFGIAVGGDHDDGDARPHLLDLRQHFKTGHSGHIDVRQYQYWWLLNSTRDTRQRLRGGLRKIHREAAVADVASELLAKQRLNIGFVVNNKNKQAHLSAPALLVAAMSRKNDLELGEFAGAGIDLDRSAVLLDDNVVAQRETKTRSFAGGLGRKEGIEHLFLHLGRNAAAAVTDPDLHAVAEVFGRGSKGGLITIAICLALRFVAA